MPGFKIHTIQYTEYCQNTCNAEIQKDIHRSRAMTPCLTPRVSSIQVVKRRVRYMNFPAYNKSSKVSDVIACASSQPPRKQGCEGSM